MSTKYLGPTLPTATHASQNLAAASSVEIATLALGCYWGPEHMYRKQFLGKGLLDAKVGYMGGAIPSPSYSRVCRGDTGHAESVQLEFDPSKLSYAEVVEYFYRTHDPTQVNGQGPDQGSHYRSAIFFHSEEQEAIAKKIMNEVQAAHYPGQKIATEIVPAGEWYDAEEYHQKYLDINPNGYECPTHFLHW